jgi:hypothetical protein
MTSVEVIKAQHSKKNGQNVKPLKKNQTPLKKQII